MWRIIVSVHRSICSNYWCTHSACQRNFHLWRRIYYTRQQNQSVFRRICYMQQRTHPTWKIIHLIYQCTQYTFRKTQRINDPIYLRQRSPPFLWSHQPRTADRYMQQWRPTHWYKLWKIPTQHWTLKQINIYQHTYQIIPLTYYIYEGIPLIYSVPHWHIYEMCHKCRPPNKAQFYILVTTKIFCILLFYCT